MMYSLAAKKLWPHLTPIVDFIFLQFPDNPIQRLRFKDVELAGFEYFLADIAKQMENFTEKDALKHLAAHEPFPDKTAGFRGPLLCGWAGKGPVNSPDQLKKSGDPMFYCSYKFPFSYWALCNEDGDTLKTSRENNLKADKSKGQFVIKRSYLGCPAWNKKK